MVKVPGGPVEPAKVEEEPTLRTAEYDPLELVDPDDPLGVAPERKADPYTVENPGEDPTRNIGLPLPPAVPPPAPADPPGRNELRKQVNAMQGRIATLDPTYAGGVIRSGRLVRAGRNALGEHWQSNVEIVLARREGVTDPNEEKDLADLRTKLARHQADITTALSNWCTARDSVPPDEAGLADAMDRARAAVDLLGAEIDSGPNKGLRPGGADDDGRTIAILSEAFLARLRQEGKAIADGEWIARAPSGEGLTECLLLLTADHNLRTRLAQCQTWVATSHTVTAMIGGGTLATAMTTSVGKVDIARAGDRLKQLDGALKARENDAKLKAGTSAPPDYQRRVDVLQGYLGAIDAYAATLATIRSGAAEIGLGRKGGWTVGKAREVTDIITGVIRHLQAELGGDPLIEDPDLATTTRQAISRSDSLVGPSSLEVAADGLGKDLRKAWSTAKTAELKALKKEGFDTTEISKAFDGGLGPILDAWTAELAKFPKQNRAKLKGATTDAARVLAQYRAAVQKLAGPLRSSRVVQALDAMAVAMTRQIAAYDQRGGLF